MTRARHRPHPRRNPQHPRGSCGSCGVRANKTRSNAARGKDSRTIPPLSRLCPRDYGDAASAPYEYGQPLPKCRSPRIGRQTRVRVRTARGARTLVGVTESCAAPATPSYADLLRGSPKLCETALRVRVPDYGVVTAAASRVREWNRTPRAGVCRAWVPVNGIAAAQAVSEAYASARRGEVSHPHETLRDLPFPHREGSTPLCERANATPESVLAVYDAWRTGDGYESMDNNDIVALARSAVPKGLRHAATIASPEDIPAAMRRVQDEGVRQWEAFVERSREGRKAKLSRVRREVRQRYAPPKKARAPQSTARSTARTGKRSGR